MKQIPNDHKMSLVEKLRVEKTSKTDFLIISLNPITSPSSQWRLW